jgi:hypothetical protein
MGWHVPRRVHGHGPEGLMQTRSPIMKGLLLVIASRARRATLLVLAVFALPVTASTAAADTTVVPYGSQYRHSVYALGATPPDWASSSFDDFGFPVASAPFGSGGPCPLQSGVRTFWPVFSELLLRREFTLPTGATGVKVFIAVDNDVQVAVNGVDVSGGWLIHEGCAILDSFTILVPDSVVVAGRNLLAVLGRERGGDESYLDVQVTRGGPTAVSVHSLGASRRPKGTLVRWRTSSEADILGFDLFREQNGQPMKPNRTLIPSVFSGTTTGHAYSWLDRGAPRTGKLSYKLQAVHLDGTRSWIGTTSVRR